jgi:hypothetical protein
MAVILVAETFQSCERDVMSTYEPDKLLAIWRRGQMTPEMVTGHLLQNLVLHDEAIKRLTSLVESLNVQVTYLTEQVSALSMPVAERRKKGSRS